MSTAPYWGQLPGPKIVKTTRTSDDPSMANQQHFSPDLQPYPRPNRASIQTANTESTFSPAETPRSSTLAPRGLAPRPAETQRDSDARGSQLDAAKTRIPSNHDMDQYEEAVSTRSAFPHVAAGAPASYRQSCGGDGGSSSTQPATALPRSALGFGSGRAADTDIDPEEYYKGKQSLVYPDLARRAVTDPPERSVHADDRRDEPVHPRKTSASGPAERRKKFAHDRSPLQRLELTLDSMTKEEKRAKVQAAEQRARQRAAQKTAASRPQQSVHQGLEHQETQGPRPVVVPPEAAKDLPDLTRRQASILTEDNGRSDHPDIRPQPEGTSQQQVSPRRTAPLQSLSEAASGVPRRNLSFRERATKDGVRVPPPESIGPYATRLDLPDNGAGVLPARSGSNKLRKEPPGDPWYHRRMEAEQAMLASKRREARRPSQFSPETSSPSARDKELPPNPPASNHRQYQVQSGTSALLIGQAPHDAYAIRRSATEPVRRQEGSFGSKGRDAPPMRSKTLHFADEHPTMGAQRSPLSDAGRDYKHRVSGLLFKGQRELRPGEGLYQPPDWLQDWKGGAVGALTGSLLDLDHGPPSSTDSGQAWSERDLGQGSRSRYAAAPRTAEAFDGEYDDANTQTKFKPSLYLQCGPLLRYCGIRREHSKHSRKHRAREVELWRGSVMIVTKDSASSYDIAPTLHLFVQGIELLPPPPHRVDGELSPEYVDPIAGHPKLGRTGETLFVRPVERLEEGHDLCQKETDEGLFESSRSPTAASAPGAASETRGSFAARRKRVGMDGEKLAQSKAVRGFRLHAERDYTFWRFNIEVELKEKQQRIAYRINRGPAMGFWVPAQGEVMNVMFHSSNGFSNGARTNDFCGPDPMWRDVLNTHQFRPFHVMIGGGGQLYNDSVAIGCPLFREWLDIGDSVHKNDALFTPGMQNQMEAFYLHKYCQWFSHGLFSLAASQIAMVNMLDDHELFAGYGSSAQQDMASPIMAGLGAVAFKYYMLFQHQSIIPETESTEPSWIIGEKPGPYINEQSRSVYVRIGGKAALLAVDCRTERTEHDVARDETWEKIMNRLYAEMRRGQVDHLLVVIGVPIAYPRLAWLESVLSSRLLNPVKAIGKTGVLGKALTKVDHGKEARDGLNDHWTAQNHQHERTIVVEDLQDLAIDKSLRVTLLSGHVQMAAIGQFFSNPRLRLAKHKDPRYMLNVVSSAIANTPPPDVLADILRRRSKTYHFDKQTDESMVPLFQHGVDGKPRKNKLLLPHRNWCSIRPWAPGSTPPSTPPGSDDEDQNLPHANKPGLLRRLSSSRRRSASYADLPPRDPVTGPRPPVSGHAGRGGLLSHVSWRHSTNSHRPGLLSRSLSLGQGEGAARGEKSGFFSFGRRKRPSRPDDGGINGQWGAESDEEDYNGYDDVHFGGRRRPSGLRGGAADDEFSDGDEAYFSARSPRRAQTTGSQAMVAAAATSASTQEPEGLPPRPFHRTPTGLSAKQMRKASHYEVDLEGGLDISINVEVNPKDPTGITVPYRILVPKLFYEYDPGTDVLPQSEGEDEKQELKGLKRLLSLRSRGHSAQAGSGGTVVHDHGQQAATAP